MLFKYVTNIRIRGYLLTGILIRGSSCTGIRICIRIRGSSCTGIRICIRIRGASRAGIRIRIRIRGYANFDINPSQMLTINRNINFSGEIRMHKYLNLQRQEKSNPSEDDHRTTVLQMPLWMRTI